MRRITFVAGVGLVVLGIVGLLVPGTVQVGQPDVIITIAGVIAALAGAVVAERGFSESRLESDPPRVEQPDDVPVAGEEIDELLRYASPPHRFVRERRELRRRTHALASGVLETFAGHSPEAAEESLSGGDWTDDPQAATFLGAVRTGRTFRERFRYRLLGPRSYRTQFTHALAAIANHLPGWEWTGEVGTDGRGFGLAAPHAGVRVLTAATGETEHWRGISVVALAAIGIGVITELASLLLGGVVGIGYVAYSRAGDPPQLDLALSRSVTPADPEPGDRVTVRATIENRGRTLADLRLIDGIPGALAVEEGSARRSTVLRSGSTTTLSYTVTAVQGTHSWRPLVAIARSLNGTYEHRQEIEESTTVTAKPVSSEIRESIPLRTQGTLAVGQLRSQRAGEGIEFQSVREYRPGDRRSRIDWRRYARFGDLTTVEFREEEATTVVLAIDARTEAYRTSKTGEPHAVEIAAETADRLAVSLLAAGHRVGLASIAPDPCWLGPRADRAQHARIGELLATHPSVGHAPPDEAVRAFAWVEWFRSRIPGDAQVLLVSPLCDDLIVEIIVRIEARGHPVTVISPDPTGHETLGSRMVGMERAERIARLRRRGVNVVDWAIDLPLDTQLMRLAGRWP